MDRRGGVLDPATQMVDLVEAANMLILLLFVPFFGSYFKLCFA